MISTDVCILHERRFRADVVIESGDAGAAGLFQFCFSDALSAYGRSFEAVQAVGYKGGNVITLFSIIRYFSSRIFVNINSLTSSEIRLREKEIHFDLKMLRFIEAKYIFAIVI